MTTRAMLVIAALLRAKARGAEAPLGRLVLRARYARESAGRRSGLTPAKPKGRAAEAALALRPEGR
jgi:hypothetical protein